MSDCLHPLKFLIIGPGDDGYLACGLCKVMLKVLPIATFDIVERQMQEVVALRKQVEDLKRDLDYANHLATARLISLQRYQSDAEAAESQVAAARRLATDAYNQALEGTLGGVFFDTMSALVKALATAPVQPTGEQET